MFLMVRVKVQSRWGFMLPVPLRVMDEFLEALTDLARVGEVALRYVPVPREESSRKHLFWVKALSPSGIISAFHSVLKDLRRHKGLEVVDVETGDVRVKVHLK
ncbi:hypothetical protein E4K68_19655 [Desulfosporosinus sp. Sb-LF]|nr:hypothetical protein E4K68_19655 [Desulfosporosinus sp. Sb-LF]